MSYRKILSILFFIISINGYAFSQEKVLSADTLIPVILENDISPNSSIRAKFIVVVGEDLKNSSNQILLPRYTRIICQLDETKRLEKVDVLFASCQRMFLPNSKAINFAGNVFDKSQKSNITTAKNKTIPKGTHLLVKPEANINLE